MKKITMNMLLDESLKLEEIKNILDFYLPITSQLLIYSEYADAADMYKAICNDYNLPITQELTSCSGIIGDFKDASSKSMLIVSMDKAKDNGLYVNSIVYAYENTVKKLFSLQM